MNGSKNLLLCRQTRQFFLCGLVYFATSFFMGCAPSTINLASPKLPGTARDNSSISVTLKVFFGVGHRVILMDVGAPPGPDGHDYVICLPNRGYRLFASDYKNMLASPESPLADFVVFDGSKYDQHDTIYVVNRLETPVVDKRFFEEQVCSGGLKRGRILGLLGENDPLLFESNSDKLALYAVLLPFGGPAGWVSGYDSPVVTIQTQPGEKQSYAITFDKKKMSINRVK